jgi:hypothetical protein
MAPSAGALTVEEQAVAAGEDALSGLVGVDHKPVGPDKDDAPLQLVQRGECGRPERGQMLKPFMDL